MPVDSNPIDPNHEYQLVRSETAVSVDGYKLGEPKELECEYCDARMVITSDPTPELLTVTHAPDCPNATDE